MTAPPRVPAGFGTALYELRKARGWPLLRAAGAAGVSVSVVAQAIRLASAYGTTVGALLPGPARTPLTEAKPNQGGLTR